MSTLAALTGRVTLHPGAGLPAIRNSRPEIAARLAPGRRADDTAGQAALLLRACPLWRNYLAPTDRLAELPNWLEYRWLGMAPTQWLARFEADPADWPARWARDTGPRTAPMRRLLRDQLDSAGATLTLALPAAPLQPLDDPATHLPALAHQMVLQGGPSGLGWTEMARGLLLHWIELTPDGQHIAAARVLAPTEWNFHPRGVLAGALAALPDQPADTLAASARRLAVAFDPCVEIAVELPTVENTDA
jgi:hypothetical protein